jgi:rubrerythrin
VTSEPEDGTVSPGDGADAEGGDPVCWLHLLCPDCGAMIEQQPPPDHCVRCGAELPAD